jgi:hypothetical protein
MISEGYVANGAKVYISSRDAKACDKACAELNALGKHHIRYLPSLLTSVTIQALGPPMQSPPISTSWKTASALPKSSGSVRITLTCS